MQTTNIESAHNELKYSTVVLKTSLNMSDMDMFNLCEGSVTGSKKNPIKTFALLVFITHCFSPPLFNNMKFIIIFVAFFSMILAAPRSEDAVVLKSQSEVGPESFQYV